MPIHAEKRHMPWTPDQMYALVADVSRYPEFLPWCSGTRVRKREMVEGKEVLTADLIISFKMFRESFTSQVTLHPDRPQVDVAYVKGPFRHLNNHWVFERGGAGGVDIDFFVDFEFRSVFLQKAMTAVFAQAMARIINAFEKRAGEMYGRGDDGHDGR